MSQAAHWLANEKAGRSIFIHDALENYCNILGAIDTMADAPLRRHLDIRSGMAAVAGGEKIQDSQPADMARYAFILKQAIDGTADSLDLARAKLMPRFDTRQAEPDTNARILNVTALDANRSPVTDLTSADFQISDDGKLRHIASFKASAGQPAARNLPTVLILYDLLNAIPQTRGYISTLLVRALEPLEAGDSVYLYLLTNHGDLYPVHALPKVPWTPGPGAEDAEESVKRTGTPWVRQVHPLLDQAIKNVYGFTPLDDKDGAVRAGAAFLTLSALGERLARIPGPKTIVWITSGVRNWLEPTLQVPGCLIPGGIGRLPCGHLPH
jgi:hypothetical protein